LRRNRRPQRRILRTSDKAIIVARRQLLRAIRDVEAGREGPHVIREPNANRFPQLTVESEVLARRRLARALERKTQDSA